MRPNAVLIFPNRDLVLIVWVLEAEDDEEEEEDVAAPEAAVTAAASAPPPVPAPDASPTAAATTAAPRGQPSLSQLALLLSTLLLLFDLFAREDDAPDADEDDWKGRRPFGRN
jgi:hypothetical protein